ncbi:MULTISPECIES: hypothetical protein [Bifidobacterium]|uniref:hypothetical protein n=1 Tax=Bifidobacterium TaxID=1678 RepID=UPI001BDC5C06|nr:MULTISPECIES: hypothetical protein [Bifidobacterium]MBT1160306.1 hypothetical protein [Bifidobacterium sp. SO1]MBW3079289.1 hypothetical protein [Bifidobacterium simiiventris]
MTDDQVPWDNAADAVDDVRRRHGIDDAGTDALSGDVSADDVDIVRPHGLYVVGDDGAGHADVPAADDDGAYAADDDLPEAVSEEIGRRMRMPRWLVLLIAVIVLAAGAGGFLFHRARQGGSAVNCSAHDGIDYCYGGFTPLEPSGERLDMGDASDYFAKAVRPVYPAVDAVRMATLSGDLTVVHNAAKTARDTALQAAHTLAARTWPERLDKPIRVAIIEYQHRASVYGNIITNTNWQAIEDLLFGTLSAARTASDVQRIIRTTLELDAEPEPDIPFDITDAKDAGNCDQLAFIDGEERTVTRRCVAISVTSHVPADVPYLALRLNLLDQNGTIVATDLLASTMADVDNPNYIHDGGKVTLTVGINSKLVRSGYRLTASSWSVHTAGDLIVGDDYTAGQSAAVTALNEFRIA